MYKKCKVFGVVLLLLFALGMTGCSVKGGTGKLKIVCTIFPQYDWVREVLGDKVNDVELTLIMDNGADLHNYQPTTEDIITISSCDLFIYVGGESDGWVKDVLKEAINKDMKVISLLDTVSDNVKTEEIVEGMEQEDAHDHDHDHDYDHDEGHNEEGGIESGYDEHVWLSVNNAKRIVERIAKELIALDADDRMVYEENAQVYLTKLESLHEKYKNMTENAARDTLLFADRFPFRYLVEDYNLNYYAAFSGCSAETEASFETIAFLSDKMDALKLPVIFVLENASDKLAKSIIENSNNKQVEIAVLNSIQSVTKKDIQNGFSYIGAMEDNLLILQNALN